MIAETLPFDKAVKKEEAKIFMPAKRKFHAKIWYPWRVIRYVEVFFGVKIAMVGVAIKKEKTEIATDETNITLIHILNIFFNLGMF